MVCLSRLPVVGVRWRLGVDAVWRPLQLKDESWQWFKLRARLWGDGRSSFVRWVPRADWRQLLLCLFTHRILHMVPSELGPGVKPNASHTSYVRLVEG